MSKEAPTKSLGYWCSPQRNWDCFDSHCCGKCLKWSCPQIVVVNIPVEFVFVPFPCKLEPPDWLVGVACLQPQLVPLLTVLEVHWLAFGGGKLHLHIRTLGLLFLHQPHKPCWPLHQLFETLEVPGKWSKTMISSIKYFNILMYFQRSYNTFKVCKNHKSVYRICKEANSQSKTINLITWLWKLILKRLFAYEIFVSTVLSYNINRFHVRIKETHH